MPPRQVRDADVAAALQKVPIFSRLEADSVAALATRLRRLTLKAGDPIFASGSPADRFFVVVAGRVRVFLLAPTGEQQVLHVMGPGQAFAEAAVLAGGRYPANAEAEEATVLAAIRRIDLIEAIEADAEVAVGMLAGLSSKLHEFAALIESLSLKDVPTRLASALLDEADRAEADCFRLRETKRALAQRLGTVSETLSRALARFRDEGLIAVAGPEITILDRPGLLAAAGR